MTDSTENYQAEETTEVTTTNDEPNFLDQGEDRDWLLSWVVGHAEAFGLEFGVSITVGGLLISGTVISGRKYIENVSESVRNARGTSPELAETLGKSFGQWAAVYPEDHSSVEIHTLKPTYIHLKHARIIQGDGRFIPKGGMLWRGKIRAIDGFTIGEMQQD